MNTPLATFKGVFSDQKKEIIALITYVVSGLIFFLSC